MKLTLSCLISCFFFFMYRELYIVVDCSVLERFSAHLRCGLCAVFFFLLLFLFRRAERCTLATFFFFNKISSFIFGQEGGRYYNARVLFPRHPSVHAVRRVISAGNLLCVAEARLPHRASGRRLAGGATAGDPAGCLFVEWHVRRKEEKKKGVG